MMNSDFKKNLEIKNNKKGKGIYAIATIPKDSIIFEFMGDLLEKDSVPFPLNIENDRYLQIGKNKYLGPSGDMDDLINHSCNPNCLIKIVGSRAFLKTLYQIKDGMELTFDYSTTSSDDIKDWSLPCNCNNFNCRKIISGYQYLDDNIKKKYEEMKIIPKYLMEKK